MAGLYILFAILVMIAPLSGVICGAGKALDKFVFKNRKWGNLLLLSLGVVLVLLGFITRATVIPWELVKRLAAWMDVLHLVNISYIPVSVPRWIISDSTTLGVTLILETVALYFAPYTPEKIMLAVETRRERRKQKMQVITTIPETSQLCFGVSGAGKSAYIGKSIEDILTRDPDAFCVVVDGKGSTEKYSLYYSLNLIARKTGKRLVILNGTANDSLGGSTYDFLSGIERPDQAKDMIMALINDPSVEVSAASEHYKQLTEFYIMRIVTFMQRFGIAVTFANVVQLMRPENLKALMEKENIDPVDQNIMRNTVDELWPDVRSNVEKLNIFLMGQGKNIFTMQEEPKPFNVREAYQSGDIVLVLADEMSMPALAGKLVQLVAMDLRNLIAGRLTGKIDMDRTVYCYFDEFSSYSASVPILKSMYARARSAGVIMTLATQSCSDILGLGASWFHSICDSTDRFVFFRQNSAEAAEAAAGIIGTEWHVTSTSRSSELAFTGEASNTVDKQYKVHPDVIRSLEVNHGILLDKKADMLVFFKNEFVSEV